MRVRLTGKRITRNADVIVERVDNSIGFWGREARAVEIMLALNANDPQSFVYGGGFIRPEMALRLATTDAYLNNDAAVVARQS